MSEIEITVDNIDEVLKSEKPVVIDFWAPWCGPCRMQGPIIEKFAKEFAGKYVVGKVNIDEQEELADRYKVMSIPTIKVFAGGKVLKTAVGVRSREDILNMLTDL